MHRRLSRRSEIIQTTMQESFLSLIIPTTKFLWHNSWILPNICLQFSSTYGFFDVRRCMLDWQHHKWCKCGMQSVNLWNELRNDSQSLKPSANFFSLLKLVFFRDDLSRGSLCRQGEPFNPFHLCVKKMKKNKKRLREGERRLSSDFLMWSIAAV